MLAKWTIVPLHTIPQVCQPDHIVDAPETNVNLTGSVHETGTSRRSVYKLKTGMRKPTVGAELLVKRWGIGLSRARRTIQEATTQQVVRTVLHPTPHLVTPIQDK
jgi:hypothetical protein